MTKTSDAQLRREIVAACRKMNDLGINQGTSGNISTRVKDGILISPSAMPYDKMTAKDIVHLDNDGTPEKGKLPSTEWRFHLDILKSRKEFGSVVHTHSPYATIVSICREKIPAFHYIIAAAGGPSINCAKYATYGTKDLSREALKGLKGRNACLLANHGVIALGETVDKALWLANEVEVLAKQHVFAQLLGKGTILSDAEIKRVMAKITDYGIKS